MADHVTSPEDEWGTPLCAPYSSSVESLGTRLGGSNGRQCDFYPMVSGRSGLVRLECSLSLQLLSLAVQKVLYKAGGWVGKPGNKASLERAT